MSSPTNIDLSTPIRSLFPSVQSVTLVGEQAGGWLAVVVVADGPLDRGALLETVVRQGAEEGVTVHPAIYTETQWKALKGSAPDDLWAASLAGDGHALQATLEVLREQSPDQAARRKVLVRIVRQCRMNVEMMTEAQPVLHHVTLRVCAQLVGQGMAILFATRGLDYTPDAASVATFTDQFASLGRFSRLDATLHLRLLGLARQAEQAYATTGQDDDRRFPSDPELEEAGDFLRGVERHLDATMTSDEERQQARKQRRYGIALGGPLLGLLVFWSDLAARPEVPLQNLSVITAPGGVVGEYFAGEQFERKVFERNDPKIALTLGDGAPDPTLGPDHWSVRWNGYMRFDQAGKWHLCLKADDDVRLFFNNHLLREDVGHEELRTVCARVTVDRGWYPLRVEYSEQAGRADVSLLRGPPRRGLEPVPSDVLCCTLPNERLQQAPRPPAPPPPPVG